MVAGGGFGGSTEVARFHALLGLDAAGFTAGMAAARTQSLGLRGVLIGGAGLGAALIGIQLGMSAISSVIGGSISNVIEYETAFVGVRKTVELTNEQFEILDANIRRLALNMPVGRVELARIGQIAGQLGIEGVDDLTSFIEVIAMIGPTTDLTTEEAAIGFARLSKIMNEPIENVNVMAAQIVSLGNNFAAFEPEILAFALRIAVAGRIVGLTTGEVLALSAAVAQVGVPAEAGGSAIQRTFLTMNEAVIGAGTELELFALVSGQSADEFAKQWETDAVGAFQRFIAGLQRAGDQAQPILDVLGLGGLRTARTLLALAGDPSEITRALADQAAQAVAPIALIEEFGEVAATTESQLTILSSSIVELADNLGEPLVAAIDEAIPVLIEFFNGMNQSLEENEEAWVHWAGVVGGAIAKGVGLSLALAFPTLIDLPLPGAGRFVPPSPFGGRGLPGDPGDPFDPAMLDRDLAQLRAAQAALDSKRAFDVWAATMEDATDHTVVVSSATQDWIDRILALINATGGAASAEDRLARIRQAAVDNVTDIMTRQLVEAFIRGGDDAVSEQRRTNDRMLAEFERLRPGIEALGGDIAELWFDIFQTVFEGTEAISRQFDNLLGLLIARRLSIAEQTGGDPGFTVRRPGDPLQSGSMEFKVEGNILIGEGARMSADEVAIGLVLGGRQLLAEQAQEA